MEFIKDVETEYSDYIHIRSLLKKGYSNANIIASLCKKHWRDTKRIKNVKQKLEQLVEWGQVEKIEIEKSIGVESGMVKTYKYSLKENPPSLYSSLGVDSVVVVLIYYNHRFAVLQIDVVKCSDMVGGMIRFRIARPGALDAPGVGLGSHFILVGIRVPFGVGFGQHIAVVIIGPSRLHRAVCCIVIEPLVQIARAILIVMIGGHPVHMVVVASPDPSLLAGQIGGAGPPHRVVLYA